MQLHNLSHTNTTELNSMPVDCEPVMLSHNDVITIGDRSFRFEYGAPTPRAARAPVAG